MSSDTITPRDLATAAVAQQSRALEDLRKREAEATAHCMALDTKLADLRAQESAALAASRAEPENDSHVLQVGRTRLALEHVAADHQETSDNLDAIRTSLAETTKRLAAAHDAVECIDIEASLVAPELHARVRAAMRAVVEGGHRDAVEALADFRKSIAEAGERVARYHAIGGSLTVQPHDGYFGAGLLVLELLAAGATIHEYDVQTRFQFYRIAQQLDGSPHPSRMLEQSARELRYELHRGHDPARSEGEFERRKVANEDLERVAPLLIEARHRGAALEALAASDRARHGALQAAHRAAHDRRLQRFAARRQLLARFAGTGLDSRGVPIGADPAELELGPEAFGEMPTAFDASEPPPVGAGVAPDTMEGGFIPNDSIAASPPRPRATQAPAAQSRRTTTSAPRAARARVMSTGRDVPDSSGPEGAYVLGDSADNPLGPGLPHD